MSYVLVKSKIFYLPIKADYESHQISVSEVVIKLNPTNKIDFSFRVCLE